MQRRSTVQEEIQATVVCHVHHSLITGQASTLAGQGSVEQR